MKTLSLLFLLVVGLTSLCAQDTAKPEATPATTPAPAKPAFDLELIFRRWTDSEEGAKAGEVHLYRYGVKEFPRIPFRLEYLFSQTGEFQWLTYAPNDEQYFKDGKWRIEKGDTLILTKGEKTESYKIIELTKDSLKLKPLGR
jgi:hypothetical protein